MNTDHRPCRTAIMVHVAAFGLTSLGIVGIALVIAGAGRLFF